VVEIAKKSDSFTYLGKPKPNRTGKFGLVWFGLVLEHIGLVLGIGWGKTKFLVWVENLEITTQTDQITPLPMVKSRGIGRANSIAYRAICKDMLYLRLQKN